MSTDKGKEYIVHDRHHNICESRNDSINDLETSLCLPFALRLCLLTCLSLLFIIGLIGNLLTLMALPYVRRKYGTQFSVLQTSTAILLIHLSFCDLLYILIGFTHYIHVLSIGIIRYLFIPSFSFCLQMVTHSVRSTLLMLNIFAMQALWL